jgi:hypothetical protein
MKIKDITYKWTSLATNNVYNLVMNNDSKTARLRTDYNDLQNFHWTKSTRTLWTWRLFSFSWLIYWATYAERQIWIDKLNEIINPEWLPSESNKWFYELTWYDWNWNKFKCNAKVISMCNFTHQVNEPIINFDFELYSDLFRYYWYTDKEVTVTWTTNLYWTELPVIFPFEFSTIWNSIQVVNSWNFIAPCEFRVVWYLENPVIVNNSTGTSYRLDVTTNDLIIDNRWDTLIVTDEWVDITKYRASWSKSVFLKPWLNNLFIFWDNINLTLDVTI